MIQTLTKGFHCQQKAKIQAFDIQSKDVKCSDQLRSAELKVVLQKISCQQLDNNIINKMLIYEVKMLNICWFQLLLWADVKKKFSKCFFRADIKAV